MREVKQWDTRFPPPGRGGRPLASQIRKTPLLREQLIGEYERLPDWLMLSKKAHLGGEIIDVIAREHTVITVNGIDVAAVRLLAYVSFDLEDGNGNQLSDGLWITVYRNPKAPRFFKVKF
jgi:hypothetical protein